MGVAVMRSKATSNALGHFEPQITYTYLPACAHCGAPHPVVQRHADLHICTDCGYPASQAVTRHEKATLGGLWGRIAVLFLAVGKWLTALAKRI